MNQTPLKIYPLLPAQEGMLFHTLKDGEGKPNIYVLQSIVTLHRNLDVDKFWLAWKIIFEHHEVLRSSIVHLEGKNYIKIHDAKEVELPYKMINLSSLTCVEQEKTIAQYIKNDKNRRFNLENPPLVRLSLIKLSESNFIFIWTAHHVIIEIVRSGAKIFEDLFHIYSTLLTGRKKIPSMISATEQQVASENNLDYLNKYISYENALNNCLFNIPLKEAKEYWKGIFLNYSKPTPIPLQSTKKSSFNDQKSISIEISSQVVQEIRKFVKSTQVTLNTLMQGAWGLLLSKYTDSYDVLWGMVRAYPNELVAGCSGAFINTLPLRIVLDANMEVEKYLREIRRQQDAIRTYVGTSISEIQEWSNISSETPLISTIVDFKKKSLKKSLEGILLEDENIVFSVDTNYSLVLEIVDESDSLLVKLHFDEGLFQKKQAERMLFHFKTLFINLSKQNKSKVLTVKMLTEEEEGELLDIQNPFLFKELEQPIHKIFEEQVSKMPDKIAISFNERSITYKELNKEANKVAKFLLKNGVTKGAVVAVCGHRSIEMLTGILGILKSGGCYLPIDSSSPIKRIIHILSNSKARIILTPKKIFQTLKDSLLSQNVTFHGNLSMFCIEEIQEGEGDSKNLDIDISSNDLAYIIYTSGSSGAPKGVLVEHKSINNAIFSHIRKLNINSHTRVVQFVSPSFDVSVAEWAVALLSGARLVVYPEVDSFNSDHFVKFLSKEEINLAFMPASLLQSLPHEKLPLLKTLIIGGEPCNEETLRYWSKERNLINAYGLTETAVCSTMHRYDTENFVPNIIGRPIENTQVYILDSQRGLVPKGVVGEIYISGYGLSRGYLNQPVMNESCFMRHMFNKNNTRLFRTGDFGIRLEDGNLKYVGRKDNQVKVRGYRIELGEIEQVIMQYPKIKEAAVIKSDNQTITAFLVCGEEKVDLRNLKEFLNEKILDCMVPSKYIFLNNLPFQEHGKIDRDFLKTLSLKEFKKNTESENRHDDSFSGLLAGIWKELLGIDKVGLDENFFDLGAHSLMLTQCVEKIKSKLGIDITILDLYKYYTVNRLNEFISHHAR